MSPEDVARIASSCTRFLSGHRPRSVRERMRRVAESPLSEMRNDQYGRGGFLAEFEREVAALLGKEAAAFMPSGTMAQPIALRIWSDRAGIGTVAFHPTCHLEIHEHMGYRELHGLRAALLGEADRLFTLDDLRAVEEPLSTVLVELPQREVGGQLPTWDELTAICDEARSRGARLHLDGARLWECGPHYGKGYDEIVAPFDSVYVSFYKILGGLPGAALAGPADFVEEARIWQRRQGGNLQQQSPAAISARLGMDEHLPRMGEYVARAGEFAQALRSLDGVRVVPERPPTNMMHLHLEGEPARLTQAAWRVAESSRVLLLPYLTTEGRTEISVGNGSEGLTGDEARSLMERVLAAAR